MFDTTVRGVRRHGVSTYLSIKRSSPFFEIGQLVKSIYTQYKGCINQGTYQSMYYNESLKLCIFISRWQDVSVKKQIERRAISTSWMIVVPIVSSQQLVDAFEFYVENNTNFKFYKYWSARHGWITRTYHYFSVASALTSNHSVTNTCSKLYFTTHFFLLCYETHNTHPIEAFNSNTHTEEI